MLKFCSAVLIFTALIVLSDQRCIHDHFTENATFHYNNNFNQVRKGKQGRLLQNIPSQNIKNLRIFNDYTFLKTGEATDINLIKRVMNISANYYYNIIKVPRLQKLLFPSDITPQCNILAVPLNYVTAGVSADLGILISNQVNEFAYVAKSVACVLLQPTNRPIWSVMIWNNKYLEFDQVGFQKILYVALHEIVHILGFSSALYSKYPAGNPFKTTPEGVQYLTSPAITRELINHFGCSAPLGIILEDQDGTLVSSHNQRKVFGNQFMIASAKKGAYFSRATLALLESTGWYNVSYDYAEPTTWGKDKGCNFLDINNCVFSQFCSGTDFACDWESTAMGKCQNDLYGGSCKIVNYYVNTICIDENYQLRNLNAGLQASQRGGYNSRCFSSNYRKSGLNTTILNNRCYVTVCSVSGNFLYILVGQSILYCSTSRPGIQIPAPPGMDGNLRCPSSFNNYCNNKKTCAYHCNKNGACINGKCLCTGSTNISSTCLDSSVSNVQIDNTGGLTASILITRGQYLHLVNSKPNGRTNSKKISDLIKIIQKQKKNQNIFTAPITVQIKTLSINKLCQEGTFQDSFGQCAKCSQRFGCQKCNENGCIKCQNGIPNTQGKCSSAIRL